MLMEISSLRVQLEDGIFQYSSGEEMIKVSETMKIEEDLPPLYPGHVSPTTLNGEQQPYAPVDKITIASKGDKNL